MDTRSRFGFVGQRFSGENRTVNGTRGGRTLGAFLITSALVLASVVPAIPAAAQPTDDSEALARVLGSELLDLQLANEGRAASGNPSAPAAQTGDIDVAALNSLIGINLPGISVPLIRSGSSGILDLGPAAGAGLLDAYSVADTPSHSVASAGAVGSDGAVNTTATSNPGTIGTARVELTSLISQLGLGNVTDGVLDQVRVELGALASRAEQTAPGAAALQYRLAGGRVVIHSPAIAGLSATLTTAVTGVQTTLNNALSSTTPGSVGSVLGAVSLNTTVLGGVAGITGGPATATATVSLAPVAAALLATPLVSTDGIVSINLGTGDVTVDIAKLLKGPGATDLNGLAANTQVLTTSTINAIVAGVGASLNLLAPAAVTLITTALNSTAITIMVPATLTVAFIPSSIVISVSGTLGQLSTVGATPSVSVAGNVLGLNVTNLANALVAPLTPILITPLQPVLATLLTTTANGLGTTVAGIVTPVITALGPVLNSVLSKIVQLTINEQTFGDLGASSATVRALAVRLIPAAGGQLARVNLASSTVRAAGPSPDVPAISASPDSLRAGQTLSVAGSEWPANSQVSVAYRDSANAPIGSPHTVTTDASGNFTDTLVIPAGTPLGTISIVATNAGGASATDTATVLATPAIDASPASVPQQGTVAVTGSGWTPNSSVSLVYTNSAGVAVGAPHPVTSSGTGTITDSLVLPAGTPAGTLAIVATGVGSESATDSVTVELAPILDAAPLSVSAGATVTATSSGWPASDSLEVIYRDSAGTAIGLPHTVTTTPAGGFTDTLIVPQGTIAGPLSVVADDDAGRTASDSVTVVIAATIDATPAVVQVGDAVTVAGAGWPGNTVVTLVYRDSANAPIGAPHTVTSSPTGTFTDTLTVPIGTVLGALPISASDVAGDTATDSVDVVASPAIAAQQPNVPRGGSVDVDGTGWPANSTVTVTYTDSAGNAVGAAHSVTTTGSGTFTDTLNVPVGTALGPIAISASNPADTATDTVTVTPTPTLTASPDSVPVEGTIAVTTTGWPPSTPITLVYTDSAGTVLATHVVSSNAGGSLTDSLDVPAATPPGTIAIGASDPAGDTASDSVLLEVAPVLTASPAQVHAGDTVTVTSSGWPPSETVNLVYSDADGTFIGLPVPTTTSPAGTFTVTFDVPDGTVAGPLTVTASDPDGRTADDDVTVLATPTLDASPVSVPAGATVTATGADWVPGSTVTVVYTDAAGTVVATHTVTADGVTGSITDSLVVPVGTPAGALSIAASDTFGGTAGAVVTIETPPVLIATPATVSPGDTVSVTSTGWPTNTAVQVTYTDADGTPIGAAHSVMTSPAGVFIDTLVVPVGTAPGPLSVVAVDGIGRTATDSVDVELNPTLIASPASVQQGGTVTVNGDGWDPGSTVTVVYTDSAGAVVASHAVLIDPSGSLNDSLVLPPGVAGGALVVSGDDGNGTDATDSVDVEAPVALSASPTTASPGTTITATGTGWPANTPVTVTYVDPDGNPLGAPHTVTTDGAGGFTDTLLVPGGTPPGTIAITADDGAGRVATDTVTVVLIPVITASPASARPGDQVDVVGSGWPANTVVTVTYTDDDGAAIDAPHTVTTGPDGTFIDSVIIPEDAALGTLDIVGAGGGYTAADAVEISNSAAIAADQDTIVPGATLNVSGSGWDPNTFVTLIYRDSAGTQIGAPRTMITSGTGAFTDSLVIPLSTPAGELTIDASDADGATAADTVDVVRTATLVATPGSVQPGDTVTVTGDGWPPSSVVTVTYTDSAGTPIGAPHTVTTDPAGHFVDVFVVPAGAPEGPISISASEPGGGTAATSVTVDIGPGIAAMEDTAQGGEEIAISGSGWLPNSPVSIEYIGSDGTVLDVTHVVTSDATGRLVDSIVVPGLAPSGTVIVRATGAGGANDEDTFEVVVRQLIPRVLRIARGGTLPIWAGGWPGQQEVTITYTDAGGEVLDENIATTTEEGEAVDELVLPDSTDIGPMLVEVADGYGAVLGVMVEVVDTGELIPPVGTVSPAATAAGPSGLAFTGSDPSWPLGIAGALVALGMLVMIVARRRAKNRGTGVRAN